MSVKYFLLYTYSSVLFTLAKQAKLLQANKLCLLVNKRLQSLKPPVGVQEQIDVRLHIHNQSHFIIFVVYLQLNFLNSKACKSGFNDPEELLPLCYKCSNYSQHLNNNICPTCRQDYIFSFVSFGELVKPNKNATMIIIPFPPCRNFAFSTIPSGGGHQRCRGGTFAFGTC